jgi:hypothetical protein
VIRLDLLILIPTYSNRRCEMEKRSGVPGSVTSSRQSFMQHFLAWPSTRLGWWAIGLGATFQVIWIINSMVFIPFPNLVPFRQVVLPFYNILMLLCGLAATIVGLIAAIRYHERSWLVWLTLLPGVLVLLSVLGKYLVLH